MAVCGSLGVTECYKLGISFGEWLALYLWLPGRKWHAVNLSVAAWMMMIMKGKHLGLVSHCISLG